MRRKVIWVAAIIVIVWAVAFSAQKAGLFHIETDKYVFSWGNHANSQICNGPKPLSYTVPSSEKGCIAMPGSVALMLARVGIGEISEFGTL